MHHCIFISVINQLDEQNFCFTKRQRGPQSGQHTTHVSVSLRLNLHCTQHTSLSLSVSLCTAHNTHLCLSQSHSALHTTHISVSLSLTLHCTKHTSLSLSVSPCTAQNTHAALRHAATSPNLYSDVILPSALT